MPGIKSSVDRLPHRTALAVFMCIVALLPLVLPTKYYVSVLVLAGIFALLSAALLLSVPNLVLPPSRRGAVAPILKDHEQTTVDIN